MSNVSRIPAYRLHKPSGRAIVKYQGVVHYIGKHGTKASMAEYARLIAKWSAGDNQFAPRDDATIVELVAAFRRHAVKHYRKDGKPTGEIHNFDYAVVPLLLLYGREPVRDFGPLKLKSIQSLMAKGYTDPKRGAVSGLSRGVVNSRIGRIKRIFKWAESEELAPSNLSHTLATVAGLQRGRTDCRETKPVLPVDDFVVEATLPYLPEVVADMVRLQRLLGCRPGEICQLRPCDVDHSSDVWRYRPARYKTQHHGRERVILVGPKAQEILRSYLLRPVADHCFTPADSERKRKAHLRTNRVSAVQPSQLDRRRRRPKFQPSKVYGKNAYARAVRRACDKAGVNRWAPNRLRHTAATEIRRRFGLEAAQVCLGHSAANVTQIYAERDATLGLEVMRQIG